MLYICWNVCNSKWFFHNFNLKIDQSRFLLPIANEFGLALWICHCSSDWNSNRHWGAVTMKTRCWLFCLSARFSCRMIAVSLVTLRLSQSYNQSREMYLTYLWVNLLIFNWIIHLVVRILDSLIADEIFHKAFFVCRSTRILSFRLAEFSYDPRSISLMSLRDKTPKSFWKFYIFPGGDCLTHRERGTETGCKIASC